MCPKLSPIWRWFADLPKGSILMSMVKKNLMIREIATDGHWNASTKVSPAWDSIIMMIMRRRRGWWEGGGEWWCSWRGWRWRGWRWGWGRGGCGCQRISKRNMMKKCKKSLVSGFPTTLAELSKGCRKSCVKGSLGTALEFSPSSLWLRRKAWSKKRLVESPRSWITGMEGFRKLLMFQQV